MDSFHDKIKLTMKKLLIILLVCISSLMYAHNTPQFQTCTRMYMGDSQFSVSITPAGISVYEVGSCKDPLSIQTKIGELKFHNGQLTGVSIRDSKGTLYQFSKPCNKK